MPESPAAPPIVWFPLTRRLFRRAARKTENFFEIIGAAVEESASVCRFLFRGQLRLSHFIRQAAFIGVDSLGIALVMTTVSGMVIALQIAKEMVKQGAGNFIGALVSMAILRELAPIMTGFSVIALAGSAYAAELGTMQITRQVDALRVLRVHPSRYLILPRTLAGVVTLPLMTVITAMTGILGGLAVTVLLTDIHPDTYLDSVWNQTEFKDVAVCLLKSAVFGFLLTVISTTFGIRTSGGAKEVGESTTRSVVWSFMAMAIFDYLLTYFCYGSH